MSELHLAVDAEHAGTRLDRFLAEPVGSRARAQALIEAGAVTVDGRAVAKRHALSPGEAVVVALPDEAADPGIVEPGAAEVRLYTVAFEDEHLLVVDKPAGVVVHPARGHRTGTLAQALAARGAGGGADPARAGIVHRLDRDTSGLLVVARSDTVHRALKAQLARRELRREYLALVEGSPQARTGTIEAEIGRDRRDRMRMSIDTDAGREARTHFEIERLLPGATLLRVVLDTGRTHQIRVHLAAIGMPVAGDPQYGSAGAFGLNRQFLHAARLAFTHPVTGGAVDVVSELPDDLRAALERAGG
ncbi:MAG TPA: RluA family pseudouridine synthase [Solirubrobacteraceae bacterium]|nr:RluA family pseudouridine synthase [Solirubrobacteraceae bacterium]